jgi:ribosomal-protein-alanine N-acetyltransferase
MAVSREIRTRRLIIAPFHERHLTERYVEWLNDRELLRYSEQRHRRHSLESCRAYWQSFLEGPNYLWAIEDNEDGLGHIGNCNAYLDTMNLVADLGILIGEKAARNRGYGLEAWGAVCDFLLKEVGVRKVSAGTLSVNAPMLKLMQRAGMIADGVRKRHHLYKGQEIDIIHMALFRKQLESQPRP